MEREPKPKERIIFDEDPYYGSDGEELAIEDLMERDGLTEEEVREEYDIFEHAMEMRDLDYEEEIAALTDYLDKGKSDLSSAENPLAGNKVLVCGSIGRWDGVRGGFSPFDSFEEAISTSPSRFGEGNPFADCEIQKVWDENGSLFVHGAHHDGSVTVEVRQLTDAGMKALETIESAYDFYNADGGFSFAGKPYDGSDQSIGEALRDLWDNPDLAPEPRYMERCFGCPAEEWEEPEHDTAAPDLVTGKWRVHLVMPGGHYGRGDVLTYEKDDADKHGSGLPLVEFYDISQNPVSFPGGQFVSRYYMDTLLGTDSLKLGVPLRDMQAFSLDCGVPAWTVSGDDLKRVSAWLDAAHVRLQKGAAGKSDIERGSYDKPVSLMGEAKASRVASEALAGCEIHNNREHETR